MSIAKDFANSIKDATKEKTSSYDTQAIVTRIEGKTAWVHIPGGVNETPVQLTVNASEGDAVQVRVANGKAWITGNASAPPTDDKRANKAYVLASAADEEAQTAHFAAQSAVADAAVAHEAAQNAQDSLKSVVSGAQTVEKAVSVMQTALEAVVDYDPTTDTTQEYFWHDTNGAHVLGDTSGYRNDITSTGMKIMDVTTETSVAEFTADNSRIGGENSARLLLEPSMMSLISDEDINFFSIDSDVGTAEINVDVRHAVARTTVSNGYKLSIYPLDDFATATTVRIKGSVEWELTDPVDTSQETEDVRATVKSQSDSLYFYNIHTSYSNAKGYMKITAKFNAVVNSDDSMTAFSEILARAKINKSQGWLDAATLDLTLNYSKNGKRLDLIARAVASSPQVYQHNKGKSIVRNSVYYMKTAYGPAYSLGTRLGEAQLFSTTIGEGLTSNSNDQLCIGKYNNADSIDDCALVIGNGTSDTARSNALTVDWSGNVDIASGAEYRVNGKSITSQPIKAVQYEWVVSPAKNEQTLLIPNANPSNSSNSGSEPSSSEYTFFCWVQFITTGWVGSIYSAQPLQRTTNVWTASSKAATTGVSVIGVALYVRNDLL